MQRAACLNQRVVFHRREVTGDRAPVVAPHRPAACTGPLPFSCSCVSQEWRSPFVLLDGPQRTRLGVSRSAVKRWHQPYGRRRVDTRRVARDPTAGR